MQGYLYPSGFYIPVKLIIAKLGSNYAKLLAGLTLTYRPPVGAAVVTKLYEKKRIAGIGCIRFPRGMISTLGKYFPVSVNLAPVRRVEFPKPTLYDNQEILCDRLAAEFTPERITAGTAVAVLDLQAGMGKTFVASGVIYRLQMPTIYVTLRKPLVAQCIKDLCGKFGAGTAVAWRRKYSSVPVEALPKILVAVINSAVKIPQSVMKNYSLIILDEIHTFCSAGRRAIFTSCAPAVLGMTATVGERVDGLDPIYYTELTCGNIKGSGIIVAEDVEGFDYGDVVFTGHVDAIRYSGPSEYTKVLRHEATGKMFCPYMNSQFLSDPYRMKLIVQYILELYNWVGEDGQKHVIFVLCENRDPLPILQTTLKQMLGFEIDIADGDIDDNIDDDIDHNEPNKPNDNDGKDNENTIGVFRGGISDEQIALMPTSRVILTTYGYASTGISINAATAMVLLTSRKAGKQLVGRILRRGGDISVHRRIIDIIDDKTPIRKHHEVRKIAYAHYKIPVVEKTVKWEILRGG